ncbi:MAG: hypothetical protein WD824_05635 [Cyclobacteriaceae bacterium]
MNCLEAERRINLYRELTEREREETHRHLETCASCSQIMERAIEMQRMMRSQYPDPPPMVDESTMTSRIMNAVEEIQQKRSSSVFRGLFANQFNNPLRYAMAAVSLFLVVAFVTEYSLENKTALLEKPYRLVPGKKTELNSASFHDAFIASREKNKGITTSLYECVLNCLRLQDEDCADCKNKFSKP